jgi:molybdopterin synthase catalytic subunit
LIELTRLPIDVNQMLRTIASPHAGGEVLFLGTVRQWTAVAEAECSDSSSSPFSNPASVSGGGPPTTLETAWLVYEAHEEMALKQMERLAAQARQQWSICGLAIVHRLGRVEVLEPSIAIAVSCPHRHQAFEAARWLIDTIKADVPIWKQEHDGSGAQNWVHPE